VLVMMGMFGGYYNILLLSWFQGRVEKEFMGRVMSVLMFGWVGLMPVSYPIAGALAEWSIAGMFMISGLGALAATLASMASRELRQLQ
jgi:hypothetical protein